MNITIKMVESIGRIQIGKALNIKLGAYNSRIGLMVTRIKALEAQIRNLNGDRSAIYTEAKAGGLNARALKRVIAERRIEPDGREAQNAISGLYMEVLRRNDAALLPQVNS